MPIAVRRRSGDFIRAKPEETGPRNVDIEKRLGGQNAAQRDLPEAAQNEELKALNSAYAPSVTSDDQKLPIPAAVSDDQQIPLSAPAPSPHRPLSGLAAKPTHDNDELSAPVVAQPSLELSESLGRISTPSASNKGTDSIAVDGKSVAMPGIGGMRSAAEAWADLAREGREVSATSHFPSLGLDKQGSEADSAPVAVSRITAPENGKPEPTNWYPWTREQNQEDLSRPTISATVVAMNLRLNMDFQTAGQEGTMNRQMFIKDLKQDLADASGMGTSDFNILKVSPGSVVVDIDAPEKAAQEIHRQSLDPNSRLRSGKVTRFTDKITMPRVMQAVISSAVVAPSVDCKGQPQKKESTCDDEKEEIAEVRKEPHDSFALTSRRMNEEGLLSPLMRLTSVSGQGETDFFDKAKDALDELEGIDSRFGAKRRQENLNLLFSRLQQLAPQRFLTFCSLSPFLAEIRAQHAKLVGRESCLGFSVVGRIVDAMKPWGPALMAENLNVGDSILQVDGKDVNDDDIGEHIAQKDSPDTVVQLSVSRADGSGVENVDIVRSLTPLYALSDELFQTLKQLRSDIEIAKDENARSVDFLKLSKKTEDTDALNAALGRLDKVMDIVSALHIGNYDTRKHLISRALSYEEIQYLQDMSAHFDHVEKLLKKALTMKPLPVRKEAKFQEVERTQENMLQWQKRKEIGGESERKGDIIWDVPVQGHLSKELDRQREEWEREERESLYERLKSEREERETLYERIREGDRMREMEKEERMKERGVFERAIQKARLQWEANRENDFEKWEKQKARERELEWEAKREKDWAERNVVHSHKLKAAQHQLKKMNEQIQDQQEQIRYLSKLSAVPTATVELHEALAAKETTVKKRDAYIDNLQCRLENAKLRVQELEMENTALKEKLKSLEYMELDFEMRLANIKSSSCLKNEFSLGLSFEGPSHRPLGTQAIQGLQNNLSENEFSLRLSSDGAPPPSPSLAGGEEDAIFHHNSNTPRKKVHLPEIDFAL